MQGTFSRRKFLQMSAAAAGCARLARAELGGEWAHSRAAVENTDRRWVLRDAQRYLHEQPRTITSVRAPRSAGGPHDYFSEGAYWWPNPKDPSGPYIRRDGESNLDNFVAHRDLLLPLPLRGTLHI